MKDIGIYDIVCGICGSHHFNDEEKNGKIKCKNCGHVLSDSEINKLLTSVFEEYKKEKNKEILYGRTKDL